MNQSMAILRHCADRMEAETIRIRLAQDDITVLITGTDAATALSMGGAGTDRLVRVEVAEEDFQRANDLLEGDELRAQQAGPWICGRCQEQNEPAFEICWSCNKPRSDDDQRGRLPEEFVESSPGSEFAESMTVEPPRPIIEDRNPYRPVLISEAPPKLSHVDGSRTISDPVNDELASRALNVTIISIMLLPPLLNFYGVYLLVALSMRHAYRDPALRYRLLFIGIVNLLVTTVSSMYWLAVFGVY